MADASRGPGPDDGLPPINAEHSQHGWDLRFEWGADGLAAVGPGAATVVVVDVLRFTSAVWTSSTAAVLDAEDVAPVLDGAAFAGVAPCGSGPLR